MVLTGAGLVVVVTSLEFPVLLFSKQNFLLISNHRETGAAEGIVPVREVSAVNAIKGTNSCLELCQKAAIEWKAKAKLNTVRITATTIRN